MPQRRNLDENKESGQCDFDFDGVIADTIEDVWASVEYASEIVGGIMDRDFMKDTSHVALPEEELLRHVRPYPGIENWKHSAALSESITGP